MVQLMFCIEQKEELPDFIIVESEQKLLPAGIPAVLNGLRYLFQEEDKTKYLKEISPVCFLNKAMQEKMS